jgi:predicted nucleic acid-binding protein
MGIFSAVIDANVLYSTYIRGLLLELADVGYFEVKWSQEILGELERALVRNFPGTEPEQAEKIRRMQGAFPSAVVTGHLDLLKELELTDPKDRHVLAAAIRVQSGALVTFNLKHFPADTFDRYGIELLSPDNFLLDLAEIQPRLTLDVVCARISSHKRPPYTAHGYAAAMQKAQCPNFATFVADHESEIDVLLDEIEMERIVLERRNDGSTPIRVELEDLY